MLIRILVFLCALIFLVEAGYFWAHRTKMYFAAPLRHPARLKTASQTWALLLLVLVVLTIAAAITLNLALVFASLILGCLAELLVVITVSVLLLH